MFDSGYKSQYMRSQREKFTRLDHLESRLSSSSDAGQNKCGFGTFRLRHGGYARIATTGSFKRGMIKGSEGLKSIGRLLGFGVSRAVFPEDLKVSEKKIFDPQDKFLLLWNKLSVISGILAVSIDPLFFYLPVINDSLNCLGIDRNMAIIVSTLRTVIDAFYLVRMALQFCTAYIAPSSRVFGRGKLVIDPSKKAKRYMQRYFVIDFLSVLPLPQVGRILLTCINLYFLCYCGLEISSEVKRFQCIVYKGGLTVHYLASICSSVASDGTIDFRT